MYLNISMPGKQKNVKRDGVLVGWLYENIQSLAPIVLALLSLID